MKRLTDTAIACMSNFCDVDDCVAYKKDGCHSFEMYRRLADYEDTGLEPEEIGDFINRWERAVEIAGYVKDTDADHINALLQAEKESRLVVLPCKVGDTVYEIRNNTEACTRCPYYEGLYGSCDDWCEKFDDEDRRYYPRIAEKPICEDQFMEIVKHTPGIDWIFHHRSDFGKTVFLTREKAEAALKGEA